MAKLRPYLFYDTATSICSTCYRRVEGKIVIQENKVFLYKWCPIHGEEKVLVADDAVYYRKSREQYIKAPEMPKQFNTKREFGCPYDCGLCPEHMQHSCLTVLEVTDHCNLKCPICYADSGPHRPNYHSLATIEKMLDAIVANEGEPDVVQISGGEPTLHPDFWAILDAAKARPIRHIMLNTNGIRLAQEPDFVARLATYQPNFEVYLQFDSLRERPLLELRGADLRRIRSQALAHLNQYNLSTTLVVTLKKGLNDQEIGSIIEYALQQPCVRGVTLQPIQAAGRLEQFDPARDRLTLTEVRRKVIEQSALFSEEDMIPVPCNPDSLAMGYALKMDGEVYPLTRWLDPTVFIEGARNTIVFEHDHSVKNAIFKLFATNLSPEKQSHCLADLLCCLPQISAPAGLSYQNLFRVLIVQFIDAYAFDVRAIKKSCVHIVQPDGQLIPFETHNLFYRDGKRARLEELRAEFRQIYPLIQKAPQDAD